MTKTITASLAAVVFSAALFVYSILMTGPFGATPNMPVRMPVPIPVASVTPAADNDIQAAGVQHQAPQVDLRVTSIAELQDFYDGIDFGTTIWRQSEGGVPPVFLTGIPGAWAADLSPLAKKSLFFRAVLPLVLTVNRGIEVEREFLLSYLASRAAEQAGSASDLARLTELAVKYRIVSALPDKGKDIALTLTAEQLKELSRRVDIVPASMALGQAAYESGYATSRLSSSDNALFGQWRYGTASSAQAHHAAQTSSVGTHFDTPMDSTGAYALNLNTHPAFQEFRMARAEQRQAGPVLDGYLLAETLGAYSEIDVTYINTLRAIIAENELTETDDAVLRNVEPVILVAGRSL